MGRLNGVADKAITWIQLQNWWPIMMAIIGITVYMNNGFNQLDKRMSLIEQNQGEIINLLKTVDAKYSAIEGRYGALAIRVNTLETIMNRK